MTATARSAIAYFLGQGWTQAQAAGIVASLVAESNLNPAAVGDGGAAYGIAQWHPDRQANFATVIGKDIRGSSLEEQLAFVHAELTGTEKAAGDALRACSSAREAGACVSARYERPANKDAEAARRGARAEALFAQYTEEEGVMAETDGPTIGETLKGVGAVAGTINPVVGIVATLAGTLIDAFTPLAREKLQKEIGRHTNDPQIQSAVTDGVINAVAAAVKQPAETLKRDPQAAIAAVAQVQKDPAAMAQIEQDTVAHVQALQPVLDQLAKAQQAEWDAGVQGKNAAAERAAKDKWDMTPWLVGFAGAGNVILDVGLLVGLGYAFFGSAKPEVATAIVGLAGPLLMASKKAWQEIFAYRFDSTPNSAAKDQIIAELAKK